ncbi:MAG: sulfatase-like hydrolase/transferase, partial [Verrucomicrobiales bacterium]|nr:sulfatase-like hydrolase/transferase [Verrucomicrobiales bacterium]
DTPETRSGYSKYLAEITYYDGQVGQILDLLQKHDLVENTIVMLSSEQGNSMPFAKWTLYDPGLRTALVARWPGKIAPASKTDAIVEYADVVPTLLDAVGVEPVAKMDGKSFLPVLSGSASEHKTHVFGIMTTKGIINGSDTYGIRSVRSRDYQLIVNLTPGVKFTNACTTSPQFLSWVKRAGAGKKRASKFVNHYHYRPAIELYSTEGPWHGWNNLADSEEHAEIRAELREQLDAWMSEQGDEGQATEEAAMNHQAKSRGKKKKSGKKK